MNCTAWTVLESCSQALHSAVRKEIEDEVELSLQHVDSISKLLEISKPSENVLESLSSLLSKPLLPLYKSLPSFMVSYSVSVLVFIQDTKLASAFECGDTDVRVKWEPIQISLLSGLLAFMEKYPSYLNRTFVGTTLYPTLQAAFLKKSPDYLSQQPKLLCMLCQVLAESVVSHPVNQKKLRSREILGGASISMILSSTKDFLAVESLLELFVRVLPSRRNTASTKERIKFVSEVFDPGTFTCAFDIVALFQPIASDWEEMLGRIIEIMGNADVTFPQLFQVNSFCVGGTDDIPIHRIYIDNGHFICVLDKHEIVDTFHIPISNIVVIKICTTSSGHKTISMALSSSLEQSGTAGKPTTISYDISKQNIERFLRILKERKVENVYFAPVRKLSKAEASIKLDFSLVKKASIMSTQNKARAIARVWSTPHKDVGSNIQTPISSPLDVLTFPSVPKAAVFNKIGDENVNGSKESSKDSSPGCSSKGHKLAFKSNNENFAIGNLPNVNDNNLYKFIHGLDKSRPSILNPTKTNEESEEAASKHDVCPSPFATTSGNICTFQTRAKNIDCPFFQEPTNILDIVKVSQQKKNKELVLAVQDSTGSSIEFSFQRDNKIRSSLISPSKNAQDDIVGIADSTGWKRKDISNLLGTDSTIQISPPKNKCGASKPESDSYVSRDLAHRRKLLKRRGKELKISSPVNGSPVSLDYGILPRSNNVASEAKTNSNCTTLRIGKNDKSSTTPRSGALAEVKEALVRRVLIHDAETTFKVHDPVDITYVHKAKIQVHSTKHFMENTPMTGGSPSLSIATRIMAIPGTGKAADHTRDEFSKVDLAKIGNSSSEISSFHSSLVHRSLMTPHTKQELNPDKCSSELARRPDAKLRKLYEDGGIDNLSFNSMGDQDSLSCPEMEESTFVNLSSEPQPLTTLSLVYGRPKQGAVRKFSRHICSSTDLSLGILRTSDMCNEFLERTQKRRKNISDSSRHLKRRKTQQCQNHKFRLLPKNDECILKIDNVIGDITQVICRNACRQFENVRKDICAAQLYLLREAAEDFEKILFESIGCYRKLTALEKEYTTQYSASLDAWKILEKNAQDTRTLLAQTINEHHLKSLSRLIPHRYFKPPLPEMFSVSLQI